MAQKFKRDFLLEKLFLGSLGKKSLLGFFGEKVQVVAFETPVNNRLRDCKHADLRALQILRTKRTTDLTEKKGDSADERNETKKMV